MEYSNDGLTLWFGTADAPLRDGTLTIGVRPPHPANTVTVRCRVDGRAAPSLRAQTIGSARPGAPQYFRAKLPTYPTGTAVDVLPVLTCAGRQAPSPSPGDAGGAPWLRNVILPSPAGPLDAAGPVPSPAGRAPRFSAVLDFLGQVSVQLVKPPEDIGVVPGGLQRNFYIAGGSCRGPGLNAEILPEGADWMMIQRDGVALPNVRTTWKTPEGGLLYGEYSGVFDLGARGFENSLRDSYPKLPAVQLAPRFVSSHPRYTWLNRVQCVGIGHVDMDALLVDYDLYAVTGGQSVGLADARGKQNG